MFYNRKTQVAVVDSAIEVTVQTPNRIGRLFGFKPKWSAEAPVSFAEMVKKMSWKGGATTSSILRVNTRWVLDEKESSLWFKVFRRKDGQQCLHVYANTKGNLRVDAFDRSGEWLSKMLIYPTGEVTYLYGAPPNPEEGLEIGCD